LGEFLAREDSVGYGGECRDVGVQSMSGVEG
jgi:hypothetical protein